MEIILALLLIASLSINAIQFHRKKPERGSYTVEAQDLLRELLSGPALFKLEIIDKSQIFLRSPKRHE